VVLLLRLLLNHPGNAALWVAIGLSTTLELQQSEPAVRSYVRVVGQLTAGHYFLQI